MYYKIHKYFINYKVLVKLLFSSLNFNMTFLMSHVTFKIISVDGLYN